MVDYICLLVTLYGLGDVSKIAIKVKRSDLPNDCVKYWAEPDSKIAIREKIPSYIQGEIVEVQEIYEVCDLTI